MTAHRVVTGNLGGGTPCRLGHPYAQLREMPRACVTPIVGPTRWVVDGHGDTVSGPFCSDECGEHWIEDWKALLERCRQAAPSQNPSTEVLLPCPR